jgi:hypothetical protein
MTPMLVVIVPSAIFTAWLLLSTLICLAGIIPMIANMTVWLVCRIVAAPFYAIGWLFCMLLGWGYRSPGRLYRLPGAIRSYDYTNPGGGVSVLMAFGAILAVTLILTPFLPH